MALNGPQSGGHEGDKRDHGALGMRAGLCARRTHALLHATPCAAKCSRKAAASHGVMGTSRIPATLHPVAGTPADDREEATFDAPGRRFLTVTEHLDRSEGLPPAPRPRMANVLRQPTRRGPSVSNRA